MTARMEWDDVLMAVNALPGRPVMELAKGPLGRGDNEGCRVCEATRGIDTPLREWHGGREWLGGEDGGRTYPALASARCMVIYAVANLLLALAPRIALSGEPVPAWTRLAHSAGPPDFGFDLENGTGALAELHALAAENTRQMEEWRALASDDPDAAGGSR